MVIYGYWIVTMWLRQCHTPSHFWCFIPAIKMVTLGMCYYSQPHYSSYCIVNSWPLRWNTIVLWLHSPNASKKEIFINIYILSNQKNKWVNLGEPYLATKTRKKQLGPRQWSTSGTVHNFCHLFLTNGHIWAIQNTPIPPHEILVGWNRFPYGFHNQ